MEQKPAGIKLIAIALLPIFLHLTLFSIDILKNSPVLIGRLDLAVFVLFIVYLCGLILTLQYKKYFMHLVLIMYSLFCAIIVIDLFFKFSLNLPYAPVHWIADAGEGLMPGITGRIEFSINKYGLRGPQTGFREAEIKILTVGGSAVECYTVTDKLTWPWLLQYKLALRLGKRVYVGNAGKSSSFTLNHIYLLENYQLAPKFDWVILLAGVNDMGRLVQGDYASRKPFIPQETFEYRWKNSPYYRNLAFFQRIGRKYRAISNGQVLQDPAGGCYIAMRIKRRIFLANNPITSIPSSRIEQGLLTYKENLRKIIALCRKRNQNLVMVTQPALWQKNLPENLQNLLWEQTTDGAATAELLETLLKAYNQAMLEVCSQENIPCIDLASMLENDQSLFYDDCHFNIHGCEVASEIIAREMLRLLARQKGA